ncbi:hypothetical protein [Mesobacillus harenae]|uniref:hypothetical protein n=1 Tax=Mesobacillus harenae TaxID=2213203 RepID=UPI00158040B0|nr:hypothetical protein [Mesobacillus harenae]
MVNSPLMEIEEIKKLNIPNELIVYLTESTRIADKLYVSVLKDVEDLYLLYSNLYHFKISQFCSCALNCIERVNKIDTFHFFLKKILDDNLDLTEKRSLDNEQLSGEFLQIKADKFEKTSKEAVQVYIDLVDNMYHNKKIDDFSQVYKAFGKLELLLELNYNELNKKLLDSGRLVLEEYVNSQKEQDKLLVETEAKFG